MKYPFYIAVLLLVAFSIASAQVASHAPTGLRPEVSAPGAVVNTVQPGKAVARVNGVVLTERDLQREMYTIFPYARLHNGIPKAMEPEMRKGALDMIIFEELAYQEALRRTRSISAERLQGAEAAFRKRFSSEQEFEQYLKAECGGSRQNFRSKVRRSLLIESFLKAEVADNAKVSLADAKVYYDNNPDRFTHPEMFSIQTISILPPPNANPEVRSEARKRAEEALRQAKATKNYEEFGLLAEKVSDDDWRVNMGDRKAVDGAALPPPVVQAALAMKPGQVSDLIQLGDNYTLFRLNRHIPAGKASFEEVKDRLRTDLEKAKYEKVRAQLYETLRQRAKVEVL